jgi:hypothetical protein
MGMAKIELKWPIGVGGQESQLVVRRESGWFTDKLTLELDGDPIFTSPAGGFSAETGSHCFRVRGVEFTLLWKWSISGDPKYIVLRSGDQLTYSYGDYNAAHEQLGN